MCVWGGGGVRKRGRKGGNMQVLNMDERKQRKQTCDTETVCEIGWGCTHMWSSPPHTHPSLCEAPLQPPVLRQQGCHGNVIQAMTLGISLTIRGRLNTPSSAAPWEEQWEQKKEGGGSTHKVQPRGGGVPALHRITGWKRSRSLCTAPVPCIRLVSYWMFWLIRTTSCAEVSDTVLKPCVAFLMMEVR